MICFTSGGNYVKGKMILFDKKSLYSPFKKIEKNNIQYIFSDGATYTTQHTTTQYNKVGCTLGIFYKSSQNSHSPKSFIFGNTKRLQWKQ